ncbi:MAG: hypothetical protein K8R92_03150 [Planctomycetes bacterium]|nr:hypothetical protein [Planctomycetota bacterium]
MIGLRRLLEGVIDYAGLFPPAALPMQKTVEMFAAHRQTPERWLLSRIAVPAKRLSEFEKCASPLWPKSAGEGNSNTWRISAIVSALDDPELERDLEQIDEFNAFYKKKGGTPVHIEAIETKATNSEMITEMMELIPDEFEAWVEIPWEKDPRGMIAALGGFDAGAKIRTGGMKPNAHPTPEALAVFIEAAAATKAPMKATAGLHHPVRHMAKSVGCEQFGFFNVVVGACLRYHEMAKGEKLVQVLVEADEKQFKFGPEGLKYKDYKLSLKQIQEARKKFFRAIGSCSFEEPVEELNRLGLIRQEETAS